jgi:hypothetical protein
MAKKRKTEPENRKAEYASKAVSESVYDIARSNPSISYESI